MGLAGCVSTSERSLAGPAELRLGAAWQRWQDDAVPHLILTLANARGLQVAVGRGETEIRVTGPRGEIPLHWAEMGLARTLLPGETVVLPLHPRAFPDARPGFALDHAWGVAASPEPGAYVACVLDACAGAALR